jgi:hypothetical protein
MFDPKPHLLQLPRKQKDKATGQWTTVYDDYLEVKWRVVMFREKYPHGRLTTDEITVDLDRGYARYKAIVEDGEGGQATGYGTETQADFADYAERAETRAIGRALALMGFGTQFVGQDLTDGEHVAEAPVATTTESRHPVLSDDGQGDQPSNPQREGLIPPEARISQDQARELKKIAQTVFGYVAGERRLRADLGFEVDEKLTLRHLAAHVTAGSYATLMAAYEALLRQQVEADVPDHPPLAPEMGAPVMVTTVEPSGDQHHREAVTDIVTTVTPLNGQPTPPESEVEERQRWGRLSRRSLRVGLLPSVWDSLRAGAYEAAERVIVALEATNGGT